MFSRREFLLSAVSLLISDGPSNVHASVSGAPGLLDSKDLDAVALLELGDKLLAREDSDFLARVSCLKNKSADFLMRYAVSSDVRCRISDDFGEQRIVAPFGLVLSNTEAEIIAAVTAKVRSAAGRSP